METRAVSVAAWAVVPANHRTQSSPRRGDRNHRMQSGLEDRLQNPRMFFQSMDSAASRSRLPVQRNIKDHTKTRYGSRRKDGEEKRCRSVPTVRLAVNESMAHCS
jgi:hypothetical protein